MPLPKGRMTIRRSVATHLAGNPMIPVDGRENRRIRLWEFDAKPGTTLARLEAAYLAGIDAVDKIGEHKAKALASGSYTAQGANDAVLHFAINNLVPTLTESRNSVKAAKQVVATLRDKIKLQPRDKTDVVGFLERQEIRSWLKSMPDDQRSSYLSSNIDHLDSTIALAIMEARPDMGIAPASVRTAIFDRALEAQHGEAVAELRELEAAIVVAESAVETGRDEVRLEAGVMDPREFDRLAAPIEARHSAPWLRKFNENGTDVVRVIIPGKNHSPQIATPEELATGLFANSLDEYNARTAA
jgi:hypothetical protein